MGQKVNPIGFRLPVRRDWRSVWYADKKNFPIFLHEDFTIRNYLKKRLETAAISKVVIERASNRVRVTVHTARPGLVIGRKASELDKLREETQALTPSREVLIDVKEIKNPELDAQLVAENIAVQLERRVSFRRAMKKAMQTTLDFGAEGVKIRVGGRLGGAEIARTEQYHQGKVPLHTLRANIDYGFTEAKTVAGKIGVKVWICLPEGTA